MYIKTRAFLVNIVYDKTVIKLQNRFITKKEREKKGKAIILFSQNCDFVCGAHEMEQSDPKNIIN